MLLVSESFIRSAFYEYTEEVFDYYEPSQLWEMYIEYLFNKYKAKGLTESVYYYVMSYLSGNFINRAEEYPELNDSQWEDFCKHSCLFFNKEIAFQSFNDGVN